MKSLKNIFLALPILLAGCSQNAPLKEITIENNLDFSRDQETVTLMLTELVGDVSAAEVDELSALGGGQGAVLGLASDNLAVDIENLAIVNAEGKTMVSQLIDLDGDEAFDAMLFQPEVGANATATYKLVASAAPADSTGVSTYSRFVPERIDDYAWENDKVAFRTYGPEAQRLTLEDLPGGTLSSGIDCWLKKVDYPIINKWYEKSKTGGSYHEDDGEGLDNFHVGVSRGCGGTGVWDMDADILYTSKNYTSYKLYAEGPIRNLFVLDYAPYKAVDGDVKETKTMSIDLGTNLTKYEIAVEGTDVLTVGLTLHEKDGAISVDQKAGWYSYWQPHADSEIGTAIVVDPSLVVGFDEYVVEYADLSHLLVHVKVVEGKAVFYSGFAWKESGQYPTAEEWEAYLAKEAKQLAEPLVVSVQ